MDQRKSVADKVIDRLKRLSRQIEAGESIQAVRIKSDGTREEVTVTGALSPNRWRAGMWGVARHPEWESVSEAFPTREDAIAAGPAFLTRDGSGPLTEFYIFEFLPVELHTGSLADVVLENCHSNTFDGWEDPDAFDESPDAYEELESTLDAVVSAWFDRHGILADRIYYGEPELIVVQAPSL